MQNKKLISLIKKHNGKIMKFRHLPKEARYAMAHYMSIDGEAWDIPETLDEIFKRKRNLQMGKEIAQHIKFYTKKYGNNKFGLVNLPTDELLAFFCKGVYPKAKSLYEKRTSIWPVILEFTPVNEDNPLPIQDGWHRLSDYVTMGLKKIPCLYFLKSEKYY